MTVALYVICFLLISAEEAISFRFNLQRNDISSRFVGDNIRTNEIMHTRGIHSYTSLLKASRDSATELTKTYIDSPTMNSRKITASIIVNSPIEDVWSIITDYDNLAVHVPNLVKSYVIPPAGASTANPIISTSSSSKSVNNMNVRIFQEGAQKIVGFDFRASLTMDMREEEESEGRAMKEKKLVFKLAESSMFSSFDGSWSIRYHSRFKEYDATVNDFIYRYKTLLTYSVTVKPKGPVPVIALEWRIKEDVPINLIAMKVASEKVTADIRSKAAVITERKRQETEWGADETLGMYIRNTDKVTATSPSWATPIQRKVDSRGGQNGQNSQGQNGQNIVNNRNIQMVKSTNDGDDTYSMSKRLNSVLNTISAVRQTSAAR